SSLEKIYTILALWIPILWFGNTLANSSGVNKPRRGRNVIGGSMNTIEQLRPSCRRVLGRWSRYSWLLYVAVMPVCSGRRCTTFTFRESSEEIPPLQLTFSEPEERCYWC